MKSGIIKQKDMYDLLGRLMMVASLLGLMTRKSTNWIIKVN